MLKKALIDDTKTTIGQETLTEYMAADHKFKTNFMTQIIIQKFQKDVFLY